MGGSQVWKVIWDYHKKVENNLNRYSRGESQLVPAILGEIEIYGAIEEEVIFPALGNRIGPEVDAAQERLDNIKELAADIENLEPGDPDEARLMKRLTKAWDLHTSREERNFFPVIKTQLADQSVDLARQAFTVRQELTAARGGVAPPGQYFIGLPTGGWTKSKVVNGGW